MREIRLNYRLHKIVFTAIVIMLVAFFFAVAACATTEITVMEQRLTEDGLTLYLRNGVEGPTSVRIGTEALDENAFIQRGNDYPVVTWLLVDNSASIRSADRARAKQMLSDLVAGKTAKERFNLCTYDTQLRVLQDNCSDYALLKATIDSIEYKNQNAYLLDALGQILEGENNNTTDEYVRIVIIGDAIELDPNGMTSGELSNLLDEVNVPIYVLGCKTNDNAQMLNEMYALSRQTNAKSWTLSDLEEPLNVVSSMGGEEIPNRVDIEIPEEMKDGTTKGILLTYADGSTITVQAIMPFGELLSPETEPSMSEPTESEPTEPKPTESELTDYKSEESIRKPGPDSSFDNEMFLYIFIFGGIIVTMAIVLGVIFALRNKTKNKRIEPVVVLPGGRDTTGVDNPGSRRPGKTERLFEDGHKTLALIDKNNPRRRVEAPLRGRVTIGRGSDNQIILDYEKSVSNRHCEIFTSGHSIMIKDLGSSNGTYLDGIRVIDQAEVPNGSVIRLGRLELEVEVR